MPRHLIVNVQRNTDSPDFFAFMAGKENLTMRGHQLREILADIRNSISASGGKSHAAAIQKIEAALTTLDDAPVTDVLEHIDKTVSKLTQSGWEGRLAQLQKAGLAETDFMQALKEIRDDKCVKKGDLMKIVEAYVGYADKKASTDKLIDALTTRFYGKIYDRDANEMAKRATPW